jgi:hypothetical protein
MMKSKPKKRSSGIVQRGASTAKASRRGLDRPGKLIGVGMFDSGIPDLASNKKHLEGFGQKSMGRRHKELDAKS